MTKPEENIDDTVRLSISKMEIKTIPMICPWCNRVFKVSKWEVEFGRKTGASHGICDECYRKQVRRPNDGSPPSPTPAS
jgi:hypothetical protein